MSLHIHRSLCPPSRRLIRRLGLPPASRLRPSIAYPQIHPAGLTHVVRRLCGLDHCAPLSYPLFQFLRSYSRGPLVICFQSVRVESRPNFDSPISRRYLKGDLISIPLPFHHHHAPRTMLHLHPCPIEHRLNLSLRLPWIRWWIRRTLPCKKNIPCRNVCLLPFRAPAHLLNNYPGRCTLCCPAPA